MFNTKAFVHVNDFASLDEALARVRELDQDDGQYLAMLREPALRPDAPDFDLEEKRLEAWLLHIIEQPLQEAGRRNRDQLGKSYIEKRRILNRKERLLGGLKKMLGR